MITIAMFARTGKFFSVLVPMIFFSSLFAISDLQSYNKTPTLDLHEFPHPFIATDGVIDCLIVVADNPVEDDLFAAQEMEAFLANHSTYGFIEVRVASEVDEYNLVSHNIVLVGGVEPNALTREINDFLPIRFVRGKRIMYEDSIYTGNSFGLYNSRTNFTYGQETSIDSTLGLLEIIRSPYNSEKHVLVIAGLDVLGTRIACKALINRTSISSESRSHFRGDGLVTLLKDDETIEILNPSLEISPPNISICLDSNSSNFFGLKISNGGSLGRMNVSIKPNESSELAIQLGNSSFLNIEPRQTLTLDIKISAPPSMISGLYYASLIFNASYGLRGVVEISAFVGVPSVFLFKSIDNIEVAVEEELSVFLTIENRGYSAATSINLTDMVPYWASVIEEYPEQINDLDPLERKVLACKLKINDWANAGHYRLGKAMVSFRDNYGRTYYSESNDLILLVEKEPEVFGQLQVEPSNPKVGDRGAITVFAQNIAGGPMDINLTLRYPIELRALKTYPSDGHIVEKGVSWYFGWVEASSTINAKIEFQTEGPSFGISKQQLLLEVEMDYKRWDWNDGQWGWVNGTTTLTRSFYVEPTFYLAYEIIIGIVSFVLGTSLALLSKDVRKTFKSIASSGKSSFGKTRNRLREKVEKLKRRLFTRLNKA